MNLSAFKRSLDRDEPDHELSVYLKALWYDAKGNWDSAHDQVDHLHDQASARIHAYLHRKEGDFWNADYWYSKAKEKRPEISLQDEWEELLTRFL